MCLDTLPSTIKYLLLAPRAGVSYTVSARPGFQLASLSPAYAYASRLKYKAFGLIYIFLKRRYRTSLWNSPVLFYMLLLQLQSLQMSDTIPCVEKSYIPVWLPPPSPRGLQDC